MKSVFVVRQIHSDDCECKYVSNASQSVQCGLARFTASEKNLVKVLSQYFSNPFKREVSLQRCCWLAVRVPPSLPLPPSVPNVAKVKGEHRCAAMRFYFPFASFTLSGGQVLNQQRQVFPLVSVMIHSKSQPISCSKCKLQSGYLSLSLRTTRLQHGGAFFAPVAAAAEQS